MLVKNVMLYQPNVMIDVHTRVVCRWQYDVLMSIVDAGNMQIASGSNTVVYNKKQAISVMVCAHIPLK